MRKPLPSGYLALVLHAHLPYVRHYSHEFHMEERWFYEAMIETYLPLVDVLSRLLHDRITFRLTLTLTPTLLALMDDPLMQTRCEAHFNKLVELAGKEVVRNKENAEFYKISLMYFHKFTHLKQIFIENQRNLIPLFRQFQESGYLDIITSASTHGFIPLMKNDETIRAQITTAVDVYRQHFGRPPMGIWLPECGYVNRVDRLLKEQGIQYFIVDTHTVQHSVPTPAADVYAPVRTTAGLHAFARDPHSSKQIWSSSLGYPGDPDYREYYRDIGFDLGWHDAAEWEYIKPYLLATGERVNTGLKYHRISADSVNKQPYEPGWASDKAGIHAGHFVESLERKVEQLSSSMPRKPMIVCPYDAELFGHWWYEGPQWIEQLCRRIHEGESNLQMVTPCEYLREYPEHEEGKLPFSSWGRGGYSGVWLQPDNDWIYKHLHLAEDRMIAAANKYRFPHDLKDADLRLANQACRELFLAQSSDWAFIIDAQTVPSYAISRIKYHLGNFHQLLDWLHTKEFSLEQLDAIERETPCFAFLHYSCFQTKGSDRLLVKSSNVPGLTQDFRPPSAGHNHILMLAWEFPPLIIGGLSRAVYDLAKFLSLQGHTIHVITCDVPHREVYEVMDQIHVHRVKVMQSLSPVDFLDWVFEMNLAFTDYAIQLVEEGYRFDLVHAHDWLVFYTARELKQLYHLPLIATIHATEHGRNHGNLQTYVQQKIHDLEEQLTHEAEHIISCSRSMSRDMEAIFHIPSRKISIIPNGVETAVFTPNCYPLSREDLVLPHEKIIFFIGRLVPEKGIQVLIEAMPLVIERYPDVKLVISGSGPMQDELIRQSGKLGSKVMFTGFIEDTLRNFILEQADICVFPSLYEPFGIVALEAMQSGTPIVVSDTGGLAEIIDHGVNGYKALPGHTQSLAWHIIDLLLNEHKALSMAVKAKEKAATEYNWKSIAAATHKVYDAVIRLHPNLVRE